MKKLSLLFLSIFVFVSFASAQNSNWRFSKVIYSSGAVHGVAVPPDNTIWFGKYATDTTSKTKEKYGTSLTNGMIIIHNPDGSFKRIINECTIDGITAPFNAPDAEFPTHTHLGSNRGMNTGPDGNVYASPYQTFLKYDYQTYGQLLYVYPEPNGGQTVTAATADADGNIIISYVNCSANGVDAFSVLGDWIGKVIDPGTPHLVNLSRDLAVSPDGKDLYIGSTGTEGVTHWHSEDGVYGTFTYVKNIGDYGDKGQDVYLDSKGRLWIGFDSRTDEPSRFDCWDLKTMTIVDVITSPTVEVFNAGVPADKFEQGGFATPRGFALNSDMTKAYIVDFNTGVLQYKKTGSIAVDQPKAIPEGFGLSQNYPNPFNPSTNFKYSLPNNSDVKIVVYDLFGREVKTLVNETKAAGEYTITWNGKDNYNKQVSTGVYFYNMRAGNFTKTMKMMLMK